MTAPEHLEHVPSTHSTSGPLHNGTRQPEATPQSPASAPPPLAPAAAHYVGVISALLLIALGAAGIRDGIAAAGWITGPSWTQAAINWFDGQSAAGWMVPIGAILAAVGLILVGTALSPRRRKAIPVQAKTSVYLDVADTAKLAAAAARVVPGVTKATASATRRAVKVTARTTGPDVTKDAIAGAVRTALAPLASAPRISVRTRVERP
ncbi:hypothetical protein KXD97_00635 [Mycobacterium sp. SMC-8]|uniref:alkaline shock response membrane anchor protein AmaP n=1 Tax=Mycobacterium sp. SMC-8 TaxID=2857060 RepID=UPI0021B23597|nr:alkaline shock response membrane anchor protein AmaP [Mycobacterium sp. SMC-8]UXA12448.1 hypothetical protein KXD97_00635 [Mycobacterium sp. SMC-8]